MSISLTDITNIGSATLIGVLLAVPVVVYIDPNTPEGAGVLVVIMVITANIVARGLRWLAGARAKPTAAAGATGPPRGKRRQKRR